MAYVIAAINTALLQLPGVVAFMAKCESMRALAVCQHKHPVSSAFIRVVITPLHLILAVITLSSSRRWTTAGLAALTV